MGVGHQPVRAKRGSHALTGVLDLAGQQPVHGYELPDRTIEARHQATPVEAFPWSTNTSRRRDTDRTGDDCVVRLMEQPA